MSSLKFSFSLLLGLLSLISGVFMFIKTPELGLKWLMVLIFFIIMVFIIKSFSNKIKPNKSPRLIRLNFNSYLKNTKLLKIDKKEYDEFDQITKSAFIMLLLEQTISGAWSNSYLYRRVKSNAGIPLSKGSLTGTPFALFSILSLIENDDVEFINYLTNKLLSTLNQVIQRDGQYLRRYTVGQMGNVPEPEPPRHTSGGLLCKILLGSISELDKVCLKYLINIGSLPMSWDKGILISV